MWHEDIETQQMSSQSASQHFRGKRVAFKQVERKTGTCSSLPVTGVLPHLAVLEGSLCPCFDARVA